MIYGTVALADAYLDDRLLTEVWFATTVKDRTRAMGMATRAIDRLNFSGCKTDEDQELQFPRGNDTEVPQDILYATYESALKFVHGIDIDEEVRNIGVGGVQISGVRSIVHPNFASEHLRSGIPSAEAWQYLRPYLRDPYCFNTSRV